MKKYLPIFLFLAGLIIVGGVFVLISANRKQQPETRLEETETVKEIPLENRPFTSLIPSKDGHWLKLKISDTRILGAESLDYELLYKVKDGRTQGVPGTIKLEGESFIERDILLGSESSGKFRYDEGVEEGTLTLRFRDGKGKLIGKLSTDFHLQSGEKELTSLDGKFKFVLDKVSKGVFFVVMETFADTENALAKVRSGTYAIFSSSDSPIHGKIE